jgi:hypothetical protein
MGWHTITSEDMILYPVREWLNNKIPNTGAGNLLYKPLIGCPPCYASLWGSLIYWTLNDYEYKALILWIPTVIAVSFLNKVWLLITEK